MKLSLFRYFRASNWLPATAPLLVCGNQKSGTSVIAALLGKISDLEVSSDLFYAHARRHHQAVLSKTMPFPDFVKKYRKVFRTPIVKDPDLTFLLKEYFDVFPDARGVFVLRDPFENIRSLLNRLKIPGDLDDISDETYQQLSDALPLWHGVVEGTLFGHKGDDYIETLALRWLDCSRFYEEFSERLELAVYDRFILGKENYMKELASNVGLSGNKDISSHVDHQYQPKGTPCDPIGFFGAANFQKIKDICSPKFEELYR